MLAELYPANPHPRQRVRSGIEPRDPGGVARARYKMGSEGAMNWLRMSAMLLLILRTLGACAQPEPGSGSGSSPPPSQDDRSGMH
jgi:hypothetical protein